MWAPGAWLGIEAPVMGERAQLGTWLGSQHLISITWENCHDYVRGKYYVINLVVLDELLYP